MLFLVLVALLPTATQATEELNIAVLDQELSILRFPARGSRLLLYIAPGFDSVQRVRAMSEELARRGVEVWYVDVLESLFLPESTSALRALDGRYIAGLVERAHQISGKRITLLTRSYAAIPVLRGVRRWQLEQQDGGVTTRPAGNGSYLSGVILFSPELYSTIPQLGLDPVYTPISTATNIPIMLYQAEKRGNRWQLDSLLDRLRQGGAQVYVKLLPGVTGVFYERDTAGEAFRVLRALPGELVAIIGLLEKTPRPPRASGLESTQPVMGHGLDTSLMRFKGDPQPLQLDLHDVQGTRITRTDYSGRVTIVNFWASWCPPCVEEIPSLNHLRELMKDDAFELISVNYAENRQGVQEFLRQVNVDFPVLLDEDGRVTASWKVLVYPSSFVIGPDGRIVYGVNAAIHWDRPEVVQQLKALLD